MSAHFASQILQDIASDGSEDRNLTLPTSFLIAVIAIYAIVVLVIIAVVVVALTFVEKYKARANHMAKVSSAYLCEVLHNIIG